MPKPKPNEGQNDFVERCIPVVINEGTTSDGAQAAAICHSIWREHNKSSAMKNNYYSIKSSAIGKASIKDVDLSKRVVTGFYNAYNFVDDGMDVLMDGACKKCIKAYGPESNAVAKIKHALFHDITRLPGRIMVLDERTVDTEQYGKITGPYFETKMDKSTEGNDTLIKYQEGVYDNHSIGYAQVQSTKIERDGQHGNSQQWSRYMEKLANPDKAEAAGYFNAIKEIRLYEGSTVGFGMNELTPYLGVKGKEEVTEVQMLERLSKLEKVLKLGTLSDEALQAAEIQFMQLKQIMSDFFDRYQLKEKTEEKPEEKPIPESNFFYLLNKELLA